MKAIPLALALLLPARAAVDLPPLSGVDQPALASYDQTIAGLLLAFDVPGASVAVSRQGKLVYARGIGWIDRERTTPVQPDSLFRIASVSKPITAVAVLKLVEEGLIDLDAPAVGYLAGLPPPDGAEVDPRWEQITVRHLLHHAGGFDRGQSGDPMFRPRTTAEALGAKPPATADLIVRYMRGQRLDFDPGSREAYSNFGYCVLGRVIEAVTGMSYEAFVRDRVLAPMGIADMKIGHTRLEQRDPKEVFYDPGPGSRPVPSVFPAVTERVPGPYGAFYLEPMDSHGAWIASAQDLVRFMLHCDGRPDPPDLLRPETVATMYARPALPYQDAEADVWYAMGWSVRRAGDAFNAWHGGLLHGAKSLMVRAGNGYCWAVLYNGSTGGIDGATDARMWAALAAVEEWPE